MTSTKTSTTSTNTKIAIKTTMKPVTKPATKAKKVAKNLPKKASEKASKKLSKKVQKKVQKKSVEKEPAIASEWFLYMVECADGRVYTGITTDVSRRFAEHSEGGAKGAKALRGKGPLKLVFQQQMLNRSTASIAESAIKKLSKQQKLLLISKGLY